MAGRINDRELITLARTHKKSTLQAKEKLMSIFTHSRTNFTWMHKLGATLTWSSIKILRFKFQLVEYAFVEGSSDLCYDKFGLSPRKAVPSFPPPSPNVKRRRGNPPPFHPGGGGGGGEECTKLLYQIGGTNSEHSLGQRKGRNPSVSSWYRGSARIWGN